MKRVLCSLVLALVLVTACAPQPAPAVVEKVVKETVIVEKEIPVKETVVVEKEVEKVVVITPAPEPALQKISVRLCWQNNGEFAALINAQAQGYYADEGLAVELRTGGSGIDPVPLVAGGSEDFGVVASSGLLAAAVANGNVPIKAVATLMQMTPSGYMYILEEGEEPGKRTPADFAGHTVGAQPEGWIYVQTLAKMHGLTEGDYEKKPGDKEYGDYKLIAAGYMPTLLMGGSTEAYFNGWATNQAWFLDQEGLDWGMIYISDYIPFYADLLFARSDYIEANPDLVRRFVRATLKGLQFAIDHPDKTAENVVNFGVEGLELEKVQWRMGIQNPLCVSEDTEEHGIGYMDPGRWTKTMEIMAKIDQLDRIPEVEEVMTNEFLP